MSAFSLVGFLVYCSKTVKASNILAFHYEYEYVVLFISSGAELGWVGEEVV